MTPAERQRRHRSRGAQEKDDDMARSQAQLRPVPPQLPTTTAAYLAHRKLKERPSINDRVEKVHLKLIEDDRYAALLFAIYDEQAVEKSMDIDDMLAAQMIRIQADKEKDTELVRESLAAIIKALHVTVKRYGFSRKQRRNMVGGEVVANDDDEGNNDTGT